MPSEQVASMRRLQRAQRDAATSRNRHPMLTPEACSAVPTLPGPPSVVAGGMTGAFLNSAVATAFANTHLRPDGSLAPPASLLQA